MISDTSENYKFPTEPYTVDDKLNDPEIMPKVHVIMNLRKCI